MLMSSAVLVILLSQDLSYDRVSFGGGHSWLGVHCHLLGGNCGGGVENN